MNKFGDYYTDLGWFNSIKDAEESIDWRINEEELKTFGFYERETRAIDVVYVIQTYDDEGLVLNSKEIHKTYSLEHRYLVQEGACKSKRDGVCDYYEVGEFYDYDEAFDKYQSRLDWNFQKKQRWFAPNVNIWLGDKVLLVDEQGEVIDEIDWCTLESEWLDMNVKPESEED